MANKNSNVTFKINIDSKTGRKDIDKLQKSLNDVDKEINKIEKEKVTINMDIKSAQSKISDIDKQISKLNDDKVNIDIESADADKQISKIDDEIKALENEKLTLQMDTNNAESNIKKLDSDLKSLENESVTINADIKSAETNIQKIDNDLKTIPDGQSKINIDIAQAEENIKTINTDMSDFGDTLSGAFAGAVATGAIVTMTGQFADFTDTMLKVQANLNYTDDQMGTLTQTARDMGATTAFSATDAADAIYNLSSAGLNETQIILALASVLSLASAGQMDLGTASQVVATMMSQYGDSVDGAREITDVMVESSKKYNGSLSELAEGNKVVASTAVRYNLSLSDTNTALIAMSNAGLKGAEGANALKNGLEGLYDTSGPASDSLETLGVNAYDADGNMRPLFDIIGDITEATNDMTDAQKNSAMSGFNQEQIKAINGLMAMGSDNMKEMSSELTKANGSADAYAKTMESGIGGSIRSAQSAWSELMLSIMDSGLADELQIIINQFTNLLLAVSKLPDPVKKLIGNFLLIGGAIMVIIPLLGIMSGSFLAIGKIAMPVLEGIATLFGLIDLPILIVIGLVALLGYAFILAYKQSETLRDVVGKVFADLVEIISLFASLVVTVFTKLVKLVKGIWFLFGKQIAGIFVAIFLVIDGVLKMFAGLFKIFTGILTGDWDLAWEGMKEFFKGIMQAIWGVFVALFNALEAILEAFVLFFITIFTKIYDFFKSIADAMKALWDKTLELMHLPIDNLDKSYTDVMNSMKDTIKEVTDFMKKIWDDTIGAMIDSLAGVGEKIGAFASWINPFDNKSKSILPPAENKDGSTPNPNGRSGDPSLSDNFSGGTLGSLNNLKPINPFSFLDKNKSGTTDIKNSQVVNLDMTFNGEMTKSTIDDVIDQTLEQVDKMLGKNLRRI